MICTNCEGSPVGQRSRLEPRGLENLCDHCWERFVVQAYVVIEDYLGKPSGRCAWTGCLSSEVGYYIPDFREPIVAWLLCDEHVRKCNSIYLHENIARSVTRGAPLLVPLLDPRRY